MPRRQTVQEYLGVPASWPIKEDFRHEILVMPNDRDIRTGKPKDPQGCAIHNGACRIYDIPNCAIGGRWAYIPQRDAKGKPYIARAQATAETQRAIIRFDKTGKMPKGGFRFVPGTKSQTLAAYKKYQAKRRRGEVPSTGQKRGHTRRQKPLRAMPRGMVDAAA